MYRVNIEVECWPGTDKPKCVRVQLLLEKVYRIDGREVKRVHVIGETVLKSPTSASKQRWAREYWEIEARRRNNPLPNLLGERP